MVYGSFTAKLHNSSTMIDTTGCHRPQPSLCVLIINDIGTLQRRTLPFSVLDSPVTPCNGSGDPSYTKEGLWLLLTTLSTTAEQTFSWFHPHTLADSHLSGTSTLILHILRIVNKPVCLMS